MAFSIFTSTAKESFAQNYDYNYNYNAVIMYGLGWGIVGTSFYLLSPVIAPIGVLVSDEKEYYVGIEPVFNYTTLRYDLDSVYDTEWTLRFPSVAISAGIAAPALFNNVMGVRIEAELIVGMFTGHEPSEEDDSYYQTPKITPYIVSDYMQLAAMLNFYYDFRWGSVALSPRLGLGMMRHIFNMRLENASEDERFSDSSYALAMGAELRYWFNQHHSIEFATSALLSLDDDQTSATAINCALAYKYWF
jgi:hypothetical protein